MHPRNGPLPLLQFLVLQFNYPNLVISSLFNPAPGSSADGQLPIEPDPMDFLNGMYLVNLKKVQINHTSTAQPLIILMNDIGQ